VSELLIGNRRSVRAPKVVPVPEKKKLAPGLRPATAVLALLAGVASAHAVTPQSAEQAYQKGDFAKAEQEYAATAAKQPAKAELRFNAGSAAYKAGDYAKAATGFEQSLKTEQVPVQEGAYYNLGNTQYRLGQKTEKENPQETIKTWEQAVKSYDAALQIAANDTEAKHNRDLVQRKIEELKKQEEQKKQDNKEQKDQSKDQQQNKDQKSDSKDSKGDSKDQKAGDKDQQKDSKEQKDEAKDNKSAGKDQKNEQKDSKSGEQKKQDESKSQQADAKKDEQKDQKADAKPQPGEDKKDQQQADAKSGKGDQPKPVNAEQKPSQGKAEAANGEKPEDAQAQAAADQAREPGQMSREEAKQLLDALKGDERKVPAISARGRADTNPNERKTLKDW
jgi:Ca-activated chloride channel family protein